MGRPQSPGFDEQTAYRFFSKVADTGTGCWPWLAGTNLAGYGTFNVIGRSGTPQLAHRVYFALTHGYLPPQLNHRCNNPLCCRPDHLYAGGKSENHLDAVANGTHHMAGKTHCKWGHEFTPSNTRRRSHGGRDCITCCLRRSRDWYLRQHHSPTL